MQSVLTLKGVTWNVFNENKQIQAAFIAAVSKMLPSIEANDVFGVRAIQNNNRRRLSSSNQRRLEESFIVKYNVKAESLEIVGQVQAKMDESTINDEFVQLLKTQMNEELSLASFNVVSASSVVVSLLLSLALLRRCCCAAAAAAAAAAVVVVLLSLSLLLLLSSFAVIFWRCCCRCPRRNAHAHTPPRPPHKLYPQHFISTHSLLPLSANRSTGKLVPKRPSTPQSSKRTTAATTVMRAWRPPGITTTTMGRRAKRAVALTLPLQPVLVV